MKKKLEKNLSKIDRKFKWFWSNYIRPHNGITYQYFMEMLNGNSPMRDDVKKTIQTYVGQNGN